MGNRASTWVSKRCKFWAQKLRFLKICEFISLRSNFLPFIRSKAIQRCTRCVDSIVWANFRLKNVSGHDSEKIEILWNFEFSRNRSGIILWAFEKLLERSGSIRETKYHVRDHVEKHRKNQIFGRIFSNFCEFWMWKIENLHKHEAELMILVLCLVQIFNMLTYYRKDEGSTSHPAR